MPDRLKCPQLPSEIRQSTEAVLRSASERLSALKTLPPPKSLVYPCYDIHSSESPIDLKFGHGIQERMARVDRFSALASIGPSAEARVAGDRHSHMFRETAEKIQMEALIKGVKSPVYRVRRIPRPKADESPTVACDTWPRYARYDPEGFLGVHHAVPPKLV
jgi:hypothetical protein